VDPTKTISDLDIRPSLTSSGVHLHRITVAVVLLVLAHRPVFWATDRR
jgi:hypothetical protein